LALSIGISSGSKIKVGDHMVEVKTVAKPNLIVLSVDGGPDQVISDQSRTEILPEVFVFSGVGSQGSGNRLAFEAARSIPIHRVENNDR